MSAASPLNSDTRKTLLSLFAQHGEQPEDDVQRLEHHIADVELPFDINSVSLLAYPAQPNIPHGPPPEVTYFVPGTLRGLEATNLRSELDEGFIRNCDTLGMSRGCPLRLLRALDVLTSLNRPDQEELRSRLKTGREHLSTIEELLWCTGWADLRSIGRGGQLPNAQGDIDWKLRVGAETILLEAKFRQSEWARLTDRTFTTVGKGFLSKAGHKFAPIPQDEAIRVVGITTFTGADDETMNEVGLELEENPEIDAVIIRGLLPLTGIVSMKPKIIETLQKCLQTPNLRDFPFYRLRFDHKRRDIRDQQRPPKKQPRTTKAHLHPLSVYADEETERLCRLIQVCQEERLYRVNVTGEKASGEPILEVIPRYLPK